MEDFGSMMSEAEVTSLFSDGSSEAAQENTQQERSPEGIEKEEQTAEIGNPLDLFDDPNTVSERVGGEKDIKGKEDTPDNSAGNSPNTFSSIAKALADEGIFPNFTDEIINGIKSEEDLINAMNEHKKNELDDETRRVKEALDAGVDKDEVRQFENTLRVLDGITEEQINAESEQGDTLRRNLIYQDFINKGFKPEKAAQMTKRSFDAGNDIEDAKEALKTNKEYFKAEYDNIINKKRAEKEKEDKELASQAEQLKKSILNDSKVLGDLELDPKTRQKIYDNLTKPVHKDSNGRYYTAIQKFQKDSPLEFQKLLGLFYTLTDGGKSADSLFKSKLNKEKKSVISGLESLLNNTSRSSDGSLRFVSSAEDDTESTIFGKGTKFAF